MLQGERSADRRRGTHKNNGLKRRPDPGLSDHALTSIYGVTRGSVGSGKCFPV